eukprot:359188-Chlamydomonas_euryale.AAC.24
MAITAHCVVGARDPAALAAPFRRRAAPAPPHPPAGAPPAAAGTAHRAPVTAPAPRAAQSLFPIVADALAPGPSGVVRPVASDGAGRPCT